MTTQSKQELYTEKYSTEQSLELEAYLEKCTAEDAFLLGQVCYSGHTAPKDYKMAFRCFMKAAELGHIQSMYFIIAMCSIGLGTAIDQESVEKWYSKVSTQDSGHKMVIALGDEMK